MVWKKISGYWSNVLFMLNSTGQTIFNKWTLRACYVPPHIAAATALITCPVDKYLLIIICGQLSVYTINVPVNFYCQASILWFKSSDTEF